MKALTLLGLLVAFLSPPALAHDVDCSSETTLEALIDCVKDHMPVEDAQIFRVPNNTEQAAWNTIVTDMMEDNGSCLVSLPAALTANFSVFLFTDTSNSRTYCVLLEVTDNDANDVFDYGWGMFIVYHGATRNLSIEVPHPRNEILTPEQGIHLFRETSARTFVMAGAHRRSISRLSDCQGINRGNYQIADAAHNIAHPYHLATIAMDAYYTDIGANYTAIQLHGMTNAACPGVTGHLTHGVTTVPAANAPVVHLRDQLAAAVAGDHPNWVITVSGETAPGASRPCRLNGSGNVQGRLLNAVPPASVCGTSSREHYSGYFIHVEQEQVLRRPTAWAYWVTALSNAAPSAELTTFSAVQEGAEVQLTWVTATETNNAGFHIEYAACQDNRCDQIHWVERAFVPGQGTTLSAQVYTHRIADLTAGRYAFRLRQVASDGATAYSPVVEVNVEATGVGVDVEAMVSFTLLPPTPHPVRHRTRLGWQTSEAQPAQAALFDVQGRRIRMLYDGVTSGTHHLDVDMSDIASGLYLVRLTTPHGRHHIPLTVAR